MLRLRQVCGGTENEQVQNEIREHCMVCGELAANCGCGGNRVDIPCAGFGSVRWRYGYENILFHYGCGWQAWK